ncbi:DUF4266 domain-containing protein [uncultured Eudoraea sp.]|jgi:hypothetical protein|uniref:DUF4266 domain-containing protein n=1 Tax=uncultured Eudoraea sp. TaxID=1035614 RepID=UPI0017970B5B|nr:DUF4266 domain-containing protein [uncultured Eudoraea sp.]MBT8182366.1 DUF4266 domain-containing protein [Eudoraea sp.]MBT8294483.1 DUF4266 domain-containing protein [Eudoraea sp.]NNL02683.1 DUF4266 domain-containing protein [Eudoraea sp.]
MIKKIAFIVCIPILLNSCVVVKGYEKVNINDPDMELSEKLCDRNVTVFHSYREAAAGANGGKTGGGCGCN